MLVSLGFLLAILLAFVVAPAYWGRAVRLTTQRLRQSLPMSEAEIRADRDRLRAQHAIHVHKLETTVASAHTSLARQKVDISRRDTRIGELERKVSELETNLEAKNNALHVLEQTIMDRVPRVEKKLEEARDLVTRRDGEIAALQADANKTFRALEESMEINLQQRLEIDRLKSSLASRHERSVRERANNTAYESDMALRAEAEALRARTREQAAMISKLQELLKENIDTSDAEGDGQRESVAARLLQIDRNVQAEHSGNAPDMEHDTNAAAQNKQAMDELKAKLEMQDVEIEKLRAALKVFENDDVNPKSVSLRDMMRSARKSRIAGLEKETAAQAEIIRKLRAELASTNDRSARQAAYYVKQLRKLGAGTHQATLSGRERAEERNEIGWNQHSPSLTDRIVEKVPAVSVDLARTPRHEHTSTSSAQSSLSVDNENTALPANDPAKSPPVDMDSEKPAPDIDANPDSSQEAAVDASGQKASSPKKRTPLLERILGVDQS